MTINRGLFIGINYKNSSSKLQGCYSDVVNMVNFLNSTYGVDQMLILTDENDLKDTMPTKDNIYRAINWLINGVKEGDCLFFHYSGHGSQQKTTDIHEEDAMDETLVPVDYETNGQISDTTLRKILADKLPTGVKLTCVFDCCHSGTGLDLKYQLRTIPLNTPVDKKSLRKVYERIMSPCQNKLVYLPSYYLFDLGYQESCADIVMISGCRSDQTSADANIDNMPQGAMTYAFINTLQSRLKNGIIPDISYVDLIQSVDSLLASKGYKQFPQLHFSKNVNINDVFNPSQPTIYTAAINYQATENTCVDDDIAYNKPSYANQSNVQLNNQTSNQQNIQQYVQPNVQQYVQPNAGNYYTTNQTKPQQYQQYAQSIVPSNYKPNNQPYLKPNQYYPSSEYTYTQKPNQYQYASPNKPNYDDYKNLDKKRYYGVPELANNFVSKLFKKDVPYYDYKNGYKQHFADPYFNYDNKDVISTRVYYRYPQQK